MNAGNMAYLNDSSLVPGLAIHDTVPARIRQLLRAPRRLEI